jgi:hypothetical protein
VQSTVTHSASRQYVTNSNERVIPLQDETAGQTSKFIEFFGFSYNMVNLKDNCT